MNNQECKARTKIINVNSDDPVFYPFGTETSKCSGTCNNINNPYAKELMNQDTKNDMKRVSVNVDQIQVFATINSDGMMINAGLNVKN